MNKGIDKGNLITFIAILLTAIMAAIRFTGIFLLPLWLVLLPIAVVFVVNIMILVLGIIGVFDNDI